MAEFSSDALLTAKVEIRVDDGKLARDLAKARQAVQNTTDRMTKNSISKMKDQVRANMRTEKLSQQQTVRGIQRNIAAQNLQTRARAKAASVQRKNAQNARRQEREAARMQNEAVHRIGRMSSAFRMLGVQVAIVGVIITAAFGFMLKEFTEFESSMRKATAVTTFSLDQYNKMSAMAEQASMSLNVAATDAADAFYFLGSAGLSAEDQMKAFIPVVTLAKAAMIESGQAAEIMVDTMKGFKIPFEETAHVADVMAKSVISSNMNFLQLGETLSLVAGVARSTNNSLEETAAMIQLMANVGIKGTRAGTTLRRSMLNLSAPSSKIKALFRDMSISISDQTGKIKPYIQLLGEISDKLRNATEAQKMMALKTMFGARAIAGQLELFDAGAITLAEMVLQLKLAGGTVQEIADKQLAAFGEQIGRTHKTVQNFGRHLSSKFVPTLRNMNDWLLKAVSKLTKVSDKFETVTAVVTGTGLAMGGILTVVGSLLTTMASLALVSIGLGVSFATLALVVGAAVIGITLFVATLTTAVVLFVKAKERQRALNEEIKNNREFVRKATVGYSEFIKVLERANLTPEMVKVKNEIAGISDEILTATKRMGILMRMKAAGANQKEFIREELESRKIAIPTMKKRTSSFREIGRQVLDTKKGLELILADEKRIAEARTKARDASITKIVELERDGTSEVLGIQSRMTRESVEMVIGMFSDFRGHSEEFTRYSITQLGLRQKAEREDFIASLMMAKAKKDALIAEFDEIQRAQRKQLASQMAFEAVMRSNSLSAGFSAQVKKMQDDTKTLGELGADSATVFKEGFAEAFSGLIKDAENWRDVVVGAITSIENRLIDLAVNSIVDQMFGNIFGGMMESMTGAISGKVAETAAGGVLEGGMDAAAAAQESTNALLNQEAAMLNQASAMTNQASTMVGQSSSIIVEAAASMNVSASGIMQGSAAQMIVAANIMMSASMASGVAGVAHTGGMVGSITSTRSVPNGTFSGAPRLHSGLADSEFAAILEKGEVVLDRDNVASVKRNGSGGGGSGRGGRGFGGEKPIQVNINITAMDSQSVLQAIIPLKKQITSMVQAAGRDNHTIRRTKG